MKYIRKNRKTRRVLRKVRKSRRRQRGGAMTPIQEKPIVVLFFHGGIPLSKTCTFDSYTLKPNVQYMHVGHPGELLMILGKQKLSTFLKDPASRKTTFEPLFDVHSMSDLTEKNAIYKDILGFADVKERPFTGDGSSLFESNVRAKEGSTITDDRIGIRRHSEMDYLAMYIHYPDGRVMQVPFTEIYETLGLGEFPEKDIMLKLSDFFEYLERVGVYKPSVGVGVIQISCHPFEKDVSNLPNPTPFNALITSKNFKNKTILKACENIMTVWHMADTEYKSLDLLTASELTKKYGKPIIMPCDIAPAKPGGIANLLVATMNEED